MKHEIQIYSTDTKDKSNIHKGNTTSELVYTPTKIDGAHKSWIGQHLYATVSKEIEPIKEGDWVLLDYPSGKEVKQMITGKAFQNVECISSEIKNDGAKHRKIIVTTDTSLTVLKGDGTNIGKDSNQIYTIISLPTFDQSFIEEYCKLGGVDIALVKYIKVFNATNDENGSYVSESYPILKVEQDNTVLVHAFGDKMYSRKEVLKIVNNLAHCLYPNKSDNEYNMKLFMANWIKDNL